MLLAFALGTVSAPASAAPKAEDIAAKIVGAMVHVKAQVPQDARTVDTLGSVREANGIVIDASGLILTIGYAIVEADKVEVTDAHDKTVPAGVVGYDHDSGFGLVRAALPLDTKPMRLGRSEDMKVGDDALAISHTGDIVALPVKVVSRRTFTGYWEYMLDDAIFTVPAHPAYGGAALVNADGELVGVGSLLIGEPVPGQMLGYGNMFIPIDLLPPVLADMLDSGRSSLPPRPWLGLYTNELDGHVVVTAATPGGPAEKAGLKRGDILVAVDGKKVQGAEDFLRKLWATGTAGVAVPLDVASLTDPDAGIRKVVVQSQSRYDWLKLGKGL